MPLKLTAGVSKKLGLPGYSSVGAICHVEVELDSGLIQEAPEAFCAQVREVYAQCAESVDEELARHQAPRSKAGSTAKMPAAEAVAADSSGPARGNGHASGNQRRQRQQQRSPAESRQRQAPFPAIGPPIGIRRGTRRPPRHGCRANRRAYSATVRKAPRRAFRRRDQRVDPRLAGDAGRLAGAGGRLSARRRVTRIRGGPTRTAVGPPALGKPYFPPKNLRRHGSGRRRFDRSLSGIRRRVRRRFGQAILWRAAKRSDESRQDGRYPADRRPGLVRPGTNPAYSKLPCRESSRWWRKLSGGRAIRWRAAEPPGELRQDANGGGLCAAGLP